MLILNREAVEESLTHAECIDVMQATMASVSQRNVVLPLRQWMPIPDSSDGKMAIMPGYLGDPRCFGIKLVNKFDREPDSPLSSHTGAVIVFDAETGLPEAMLDGGAVTAIRTASASALATRLLARSDRRVLGLIGNGEEAWHHAQSHAALGGFEEVIVWGRSEERAQAFATRLSEAFDLNARAEADAERCVRAADVICTVTSAGSPVIYGDWIQPGSHVNLVGAAVRGAKETDDATVTRSRFFVDYKESALDQAGELIDVLESGKDYDDVVAGEIGDVVLGRVEGRQDADQITVYKSLGVAAQDLAAGIHALTLAKQKGIGVSVDWSAHA